MAREGVPLIVIQRQLGHTNLGITSIYLQRIDNTEIIDTVHARRAPMVPVDSSLRRSRRDRRRGSRRLARRRSSPTSPAENPLASGSQRAPFIAKDRCTRLKRPPQFRRSSTHAPRWLSCAASRNHKPPRAAIAAYGFLVDWVDT